MLSPLTTDSRFRTQSIYGAVEGGRRRRRRREIVIAIGLGDRGDNAPPVALLELLVVLKHTARIVPQTLR